MAGGAVCVIPAAGYSSRMERWKLLLPFGEQTVLECVIGAAREVVERVIVVTGYRRGRIERLLSSRADIHLVPNPEFESGMFSSIRCGLRHAPDVPVFVTPADMPLIRPGDYRVLLRHYSGADDCDAVRPIFADRPGHPVLLSPRIVTETRNRKNASSMREVLEEYRVCSVEAADPRVILDIDTEDDYRRLLQARDQPRA